MLGQNANTGSKRKRASSKKQKKKKEKSDCVPNIWTVKLLCATRIVYNYSIAEQQNSQIKDMCPICQSNTRQLQ